MSDVSHKGLKKALTVNQLVDSLEINMERNLFMPQHKHHLLYGLKNNCVAANNMLSRGCSDMKQIHAQSFRFRFNSIKTVLLNLLILCFSICYFDAAFSKNQ